MLGICLELRLADWTLGAMPALPGVFLFWTVGNTQMMDVEVCKGKMRSHRLYQTCQDCFVSSQQGSHVGKAGCCAESYQKVVACQAKSGLESQYEVMNIKLGTSINFLSNVASGPQLFPFLPFISVHLLWCHECPSLNVGLSKLLLLWQHLPRGRKHHVLQMIQTQRSMAHI